jgi:succinate dehydrogenase hydrophobic anchor subunit
MAVTDSVGVGSDPVMRGNALQTDKYSFMRISRVVMVVVVVVHLGRDFR